MKNINGCILKVFLALMILSMGSLVWASESEGGEWHLLSPRTIELKEGEKTNLTLGVTLHSGTKRDESIKQTIEIQGASFVINPYTGESEFTSSLVSGFSSSEMQVGTKVLVGNKLTSKLLLQVYTDYRDDSEVIFDQITIYREAGQKGDITLTFNHDPSSKIVIKVVEHMPVGALKPSVHVSSKETQNIYGTQSQITLEEEQAGQLKKGVIEITLDGIINVQEWFRGIEATEGDIKFKVWESSKLGNKVWLEIISASTKKSVIDLRVEKNISMAPLSNKKPFRNYDISLLGDSFSKNLGVARQVIEDCVCVRSNQSVTSRFLEEAILFKAGSEGYLIGKDYYPINAFIYTHEGKVIAPIRSILESMGINDYHMTYQKGKLVLRVKQEENTKEIVLEVGNKTAKVNQKAYILDASPQLIEGKVYVQVSKIAELLNGRVSYYLGADAVQIDLECELNNEEICILSENAKVKVGLRDQKAGAICIEEGKAEKLQKGRIELKLDQSSYPNILNEIALDKPIAEVIKGDIEIKPIGWDETNATYIIEVTKLSTKPSAIFINYPAISISRTLPESYYGLEVSGKALGEKSFLVERFISTYTPNTCELLINSNLSL